MASSRLGGGVVLVTGGTGFIGRRLLPLLVDTGAHIHAISRRGVPGGRGSQWHSVDLGDRAAVTELLARLRPTHLLHLAWETSHGSYYTTPDNLRCLRDSLHLLYAFAASGGQRFVGAGTSAEYDLTVGTELSEASTPLRPNGLYGACKKALFEVASSLASQSSLSVGWARIFFCYGPGEHPDRPLPTLLRALDRGERVPFQHGKAVRDYVFVDDVAAALAELLASGYQGPVNIGSGTPVTLATVATRLAELAGRPDALDFGAVPAPAYEPLRVVADIRRARDALRWAPRWSLDEGLSLSIASWR